MSVQCHKQTSAGGANGGLIADRHEAGNRQARGQFIQRMKRSLHGNDVAVGPETANHRLDGG